MLLLVVSASWFFWKNAADEDQQQLNISMVGA
jgi:hypothetical protein